MKFKVKLCLFASMAAVWGAYQVSTADSAKAIDVAAAASEPAVRQVFQPQLPKEMTSATNPITPEKVKLGRMLYYDARLSKSGKISCNSCHVLDKYGVDNEPTSPGHDGERGGRNSPTVYNAAGHIAQFWDGRAKDVEEQAKGPILNPIEMAMPSEQVVVEFLKSTPGYVKAFKKAFPDDADPVTYDNLGKAIGAFERGLITPSPFDKYLAGDDSALSAAEKAGLDLFVSSGCTTCHVGTYLGGNMYQKLGLAKPWPNTKDQGRYEVSKNDADKMMFKVPSLRNVTKTAPYFHDGSIADLKEAVKLMASHQLARDLSEEEASSISTFLGSLSGNLPERYIKKPKLP